MRSTTVPTNLGRAAKAVRLVFVSGVIAGLAALFSCTEADNTITAPLKNSPDIITDSGWNHAARLNVCVDPSSPPGVYKFTNSEFVVGGNGVTRTNVPDGEEYEIAAGACKEVMSRVSGDSAVHEVNNEMDPFSGLTVTATTIPAYATYAHTDCHQDTLPHGISTDMVSPTPCGNNNNPTRAYINIHHGIELHFIFAPIPIAAQFVIGDVEPHSPSGSGTLTKGKNKANGLSPIGGDIVNFWGSQWWKNNQMSVFTSPGYPSFKGYADVSDNFCGGTWTSLPGNSSKPPQTIGEYVAIIVTDNVVKKGPNLSGNIKEILLVHQDGGYRPNPGHDGNGPVTTVLCKMEN